MDVLMSSVHVPWLNRLCQSHLMGHDCRRRCASRGLPSRAVLRSAGSSLATPVCLVLCLMRACLLKNAVGAE